MQAFREGSPFGKSEFQSQSYLIWSHGSVNPGTQTQGGKCESESRGTKRARVPFVVALEQAARFVTTLPHGGIYDIRASV